MDIYVSLHKFYILVYMYVPLNLDLQGGGLFNTPTWIHLIDSGGQPEFHDLLPIFVHNTSLVMFVFNVSEPLNKNPMIEYYDSKGQPVGEPYTSYLSHREILEHSLQVFQAQDTQCPKVMVIGTHKDVTPHMLSIDWLDKCFKHFSSIIRFGRAPILEMDCYKMNQIEIEPIRTQILDLGSDHHIDVPIGWFLLELALKEESIKSKGILSLKECEEVATTFKMNNKEFAAALEYLVQHNIFLHYPEALPGVVFCDPQILLDEVTKIVEHHYKLSSSRSNSPMSDDMVMFVDNACISESVIKAILPQYKKKDYIITPHSFFQLLSYLNIISPIQLKHSSGVYLMPALLSNATNLNDIVKSIPGKEDVPPLGLWFEGGCVPYGLFCSLVTGLLHSSADWELSKDNGKPYRCFRNCISFLYCIQTIVTFMDIYSHFLVCIQTPPESTKTIALEIKKNIAKTIGEATKRLHYSRLKWQWAIKCPFHKEENHVAILHNPPNECCQCTVINIASGPIPKECSIWSTAGKLALSDYIVF